MKNHPKHPILRILTAVVGLVLLAAVLSLTSCRSSDGFGQRRTPRGCNTCTKWSK